MKREEAIEVLRKLPIGLMDLSYEQRSDLTEALNIALAALRSPTREQVEKLRGEWEGTADGYADGALIWDEWACSECGYAINEDDVDRLPNFCPNCGAPMTDEAVEITLRRLEALKDGTTD